MAEFPAMPLWTDRYLADTRHLSTLEHGAYMLLLMEAWRRPGCSLPDNDVLLSRLAGLAADEWQAIKSTVMAFWKFDGRAKEWTQKTLTKERDYVSKKSGSQRDKAVKRWTKTTKTDAVAMPEGMPEACPADAPTPTPTIEESSLRSDTRSRLRIGEAELLVVLDAERARAVVDHRLRIKKPMSAHAAKLLAGKFARCPDPNAAADVMIGNGWQGFEPEWLDRQGVRGASNQKPQSTGQIFADLARSMNDADNDPAHDGADQANEQYALPSPRRREG